MRFFHLLSAASLFLALLPAAAPARAEAAGISASEALAVLEQLAGEWVGTVTEPGSGPPVTVIYRLTAGGSAVEEILFPGTPHEMVTMYHLDRGELVLTHYCAMGNQPRMALQPASTRDRLIFDFVSAGNLASPDDMHMHSGAIHFPEADRIEASWDVFHHGRKVDENRFFLRRK